MNIIQVPTDINAVRVKRARRAEANPFDQLRNVDDAYQRDAWAFYCRVIGKTISFEEWEEIHDRDDTEAILVVEV